MNLKTAFPLMVMGYLLLTGVFFLVAGLFGWPFLAVDASRASAVNVLSGVFILLSFSFYIAWQRGNLNKRGKTLLQVRLEAVEKAKERSTLLKIAEDEDENPDVRRRAAERLAQFKD